MTRIGDKQARLDQIKADIIENGVCQNLAKTATQLVFGDGSVDASIVMIGEAPGKNEDLKGLPFVGAAGKFLNEMLESVGMKRADVYITNIVKYRPPNNRDPLPEEKKEFLPYLLAQIDVIQPKIVVTLGRHSMNCFLPDMQISQIHGQPKRTKLRVSSKKQDARSKKQDAGYQDVDAAQGSSEAHIGQNTEGNQGVDAMQGDMDQMPAGLDAAQGSSEARGKLYKEVQLASTGADDTAMRQKTLGAVELGSTQTKVVQLVILPLYHPAAALYNGAMRQTLTDDFAKIPAILNKLEI